MNKSFKTRPCNSPLSWRILDTGGLLQDSQELIGAVCPPHPHYQGDDKGLKASRPANMEDKLKCKVCKVKCSDIEVLGKHMTRVHKSASAQNVTSVQSKTTWKITPNLSTRDVDNLLEDEEEIRDEVERHNVGINDSAALWQGVNFGSSFGNSGEFAGRNASTLTRLNKCDNCEINSKTLDTQRELLSKLDKQIQHSHKIQRDDKNEKKNMKKNLDEAIKVVEELTTENTNLKEDLQVQKDLVVALKLKLEDTVSGPNQEQNIEEGPLPDDKRKCNMCNYTSKNCVLLEKHKKSHREQPDFKSDLCEYKNKKRELVVRHAEKHKQQAPQSCTMCNFTTMNQELLQEHIKSHQQQILLKCDMCNFSNKDSLKMQEHKESHKDQSEFKCLMCATIMPNLDSFKKHKKKHHQELNIGHSINYPMNVYSFKCTPCKISFMTHNDLLDHMCDTHLSKDQRHGPEQYERQKQHNSNAKSVVRQGMPGQTENVALCRNGPQCLFYRQSRCNFYHPQLPQKQHPIRLESLPRQERRPRQAPTNQWQDVHSWWPQYQGQQHQETHKKGAQKHRLSTWCQHDENCLQGRFCALREQGEQDFTRRSPHWRQ